MSKSLKLNKKELYFVPLGGCGHFGANLNLYHYDGQWLAIDCGMGFADERLPGVDILLPDPSFIEERNDKLAGLIITHAHEDHIGGVAHLWPRLKCPVYATPFTMEVLKRKLQEVPYGDDVPLIEVENKGKASVGPFDLEWVNMAHSIPDTSSIIVRTPEGVVLHSGDWNFDPAPMAGFKSDEERLKALGEEGVLAYVGDSTNSCVPGTSGSESELCADFEKLFKRAKGKIGVTLFSSNIGRLKTVLKAAKTTDRYVCPVGRSLKNMADIARQFDIIEEDGIFVSEEEAAYCADDRIVYVLTGSQGEPRAQLPKVAKGEHPTVTLGDGDMLLFSARAIPGNERGIIDMRNMLVARGVEVITPKQAHIHVSGHPAQDEVAHMFQLTRPHCVIPVHGEVEQQEGHALIAQRCQVPHSLVPENGAVIRISKEKGLEHVDHVPTELLACDQTRIISMDHPTIRERRKLSFNGSAFASFAVDKHNNVSDFQLSTLGVVDEVDPQGAKALEELFDRIEERFERFSDKEWVDTGYIEEEIRILIRRYFRNEYKLSPITIVHMSRFQ